MKLHSKVLYLLIGLTVTTSLVTAFWADLFPVTRPYKSQLRIFTNNQLYKYERLKKEITYKTDAKTSEQHYMEHKRDVKACVAAFGYLNQNDKELLAFFDEIAVPGQPTDFLDILKKSRFAQQQQVKHILDNPTRFDIESDCHNPSTAQTIYCVTCEPEKELRSKKIESLGISKQGWLIREELLNQSLLILNQPGCEACFGVDFENLLAQIKKTKTTYQTSYAVEMRRWLRKAINKIRNDGVGGEGSAGRSGAE